MLHSQQNILSHFPQQHPQGLHSQGQSFSLPNQQMFSSPQFTSQLPQVPPFIHQHSHMFLQPPYPMPMMIDGKGSTTTDYSQSQKDLSFSNLTHTSSIRSNLSSVFGASSSENDNESKKHIAPNLNLTSFDSSSSLSSLPSFPNIPIASHFSEPKITEHHELSRTDSGRSGVWTAGKKLYRKNDDDETSSTGSLSSAFSISSSADFLGTSISSPYDDNSNFVVHSLLQMPRNQPASLNPFFPLAGQDSKRSVS